MFWAGAAPVSNPHFVGKSPTLFMQGATFQNFLRLYFLVNDYENCDRQCQRTMYLRKDSQNVPKDLVFLKILIL